MSVFNDGMMGESKSAVQQNCRRDYEAEIARIRKRNGATSELLISLERYIGEYGRYGREQFTLPSLYGSLMLEMKAQQKLIEQIQEDWEREK